MYFTFIRDEEILHLTTPTVLNNEEDDILNLAENEREVNGGEEVLEDEDDVIVQEDVGVGDEFSGVEIAALKENTNTETVEESQEENTEKDFEEVKISLSSHSKDELKTQGSTHGEEDSPINRIHSEILELTRRISMPEAGILNLIRATEEAENEAKRQNEAATAASSPSKESLLLRAMAEHGSTDFSIQGGFRGLTPRDPKQASSSPSVSKSPTVGAKAKLQSDEGGKTSVAEKESLSTIPRKDTTVTLNSEVGVPPGDIIVKPPTTEELPQTAGKGTETRKSEVTDRDMLGLLKCFY